LESEALKEKVLERLGEMPEELRQRAPSKDAWSASEVVEHLIITEEQAAGPWRDSLRKNPSVVPLGIRSKVVTAMLAVGLGRSNMRVPTLPELVPHGGLSLADLSLRWSISRVDLAGALPENSEVAWTTHPAFGPLSSAQIGKILVAHLKHHLRNWPQVGK
jgi:hypothetical protein